MRLYNQMFDEWFPVRYCKQVDEISVGLTVGARKDFKIIWWGQISDLRIGQVKTLYKAFLSNCSKIVCIQKDLRGFVEAKQSWMLWVIRGLTFEYTSTDMVGMGIFVKVERSRKVVGYQMIRNINHYPQVLVVWEGKKMEWWMKRGLKLVEVDQILCVLVHKN